MWYGFTRVRVEVEGPITEGPLALRWDDINAWVEGKQVAVMQHGAPLRNIHATTCDMVQRVGSPLKKERPQN